MAKPVRLTLYVDNDQLKRAFKESEDAADKFSRKVDDNSSKVKASTIALGAAVGTAAVDIAAKLAKIAFDAAVWLPKLGEEFDNVADKIRISVGNNPLLNGGLQLSFQNVFGDVASSMDDTGSAIATLYQRLGLTGPALETLATQILNLSRITGTDLAANLDAVTTAFNIFNVPAAEMGAQLDYLFKASQASGVPLNDLASDVQNNAAQLQLLGLSFEDAVAASASLGKAGVNLGDLSAGFKRLFAEAVKNGKPAEKVFQEYADGIADGSISSAEALEALGARGGTQFISLAQQGKLSFGEIADAINGATDTIDQATADTNDWPEQWSTTWNKIQLAVKPAAEGAFKFLGDLLDDMVVVDEQGNITGLNLAAAWDRVADKWSEVWDTKIQPWLGTVKDKIQTWWDGGGKTQTEEVLTEIGRALGEALFNALKAAIGEGLNSLPDALREGLGVLYGDEQQGAGSLAGGFPQNISKADQDWLNQGTIYGERFENLENKYGYDFNKNGTIGRSMGGPVWPGQAYTVGEHRRETFVPTVPGKILPDATTGGKGDVFNLYGPDPKAQATELIRVRRKQAYLAGSR